MKIQSRTEKGKAVRSTLITPGVLYGKGMTSAPIQVETSELEKMFHSKGTSKTFEVTLGKTKHIVYFKEVQQVFHVPGTFTHFDLVKVAADDTMTSKVHLEFLNQNLVEKKGFIVNTVKDTIEIEYPVGSGISSLKLDIGALEDTDTLKVKDIVPPKDITILDDMEDTVVSISHQRPEEEETTDEQAEYVTEVESVKQNNE